MLVEIFAYPSNTRFPEIIEASSREKRLPKNDKYWPHCICRKSNLRLVTACIWINILWDSNETLLTLRWIGYRVVCTQIKMSSDVQTVSWKFALSVNIEYDLKNLLYNTSGGIAGKVVLKWDYTMKGDLIGRCLFFRQPSASEIQKNRRKVKHILIFDSYKF